LLVFQEGGLGDPKQLPACAESGELAVVDQAADQMGRALPAVGDLSGREADHAAGS
jgi:hypothetical protein